MATYAAFKHVELHKVGYGKNRVANAPRGCISEIFSGNEGANGAGKSASGSPGRAKDTHSRLFGPSDRPSTVVRDTLKSNISFGSSNGHHGANGHHQQVHQVAVEQQPQAKEGNPISGEGYKSMNGEINTVTALNGNGTQINHNRIPPGGYSSGLW